MSYAFVLEEPEAALKILFCVKRINAFTEFCLTILNGAGNKLHESLAGTASEPFVADTWVAARLSADNLPHESEIYPESARHLCRKSFYALCGTPGRFKMWRCWSGQCTLCYDKLLATRSAVRGDNRASAAEKEKTDRGGRNYDRSYGVNRVLC